MADCLFSFGSKWVALVFSFIILEKKVIIFQSSLPKKWSRKSVSLRACVVYWNYWTPGHWTIRPVEANESVSTVKKLSLNCLVNPSKWLDINYIYRLNYYFSIHGHQVIFWYHFSFEKMVKCLDFCILCLVGPAEALFEEPYYNLMKGALKPGGIICTQGKIAFFVSYTIVNYPRRNLKENNRHAN